MSARQRSFSPAVQTSVGASSSTVEFNIVGCVPAPEVKFHFNPARLPATAEHTLAACPAGTSTALPSSPACSPWLWATPSQRCCPAPCSWRCCWESLVGEGGGRRRLGVRGVRSMGGQHLSSAPGGLRSHTGRPCCQHREGAAVTIDPSLPMPAWEGVCLPRRRLARGTDACRPRCHRSSFGGNLLVNRAFQLEPAAKASALNFSQARLRVCLALRKRCTD